MIKILELNKIYNEDCLEGMKKIDDKSINLIVIDPPYNIGKDKTWDKWKTVEEYVIWMGQVFKECERVLKDNGSFYFFHNDFEQMAELQHWIKKYTKFIFKSLITWDKLTNADTVQIGSLAKGYGNLRNYFSGSTSEYCMFYTLTDDNIVENYQLCRTYSKKVLDYIGLSKKNVINNLGQKVDHFFRYNSSQWGFPTEDTYKELVNKFHINKMDNFKEYKEFEALFNYERYTYNKPKIQIKGTNLKELKNNLRNVTTVWNFERPKNNYKLGHVTPKPINMIKHIINVSSNEGDIVLDCFMGSGTTAVACINTKRNFLGFEKDTTYCDLANKRIQDIV